MSFIQRFRGSTVHIHVPLYRLLAYFINSENSTAGSTEALVPPATPSPPAASQGDEEGDERIMAGSLVVEEYDWRSIETKLPLLRLTTTGVKGALMKIDRKYVTLNWSPKKLVPQEIGPLRNWFPQEM